MTSLERSSRSTKRRSPETKAWPIMTEEIVILCHKIPDAPDDPKTNCSTCCHSGPRFGPFVSILGVSQFIARSGTRGK